MVASREQRKERGGGGEADGGETHEKKGT